VKTFQGHPSSAKITASGYAIADHCSGIFGSDEEYPGPDRCEVKRMRKIVVGRVLTTILSVFPACAAQQELKYGNWKSDLVGLKRRITLFAADGTAFKAWEGR
jgi:hypothetical protein